MQLKTYFYPVIVLLLFFVIQNAMAQGTLVPNDSIPLSVESVSDSISIPKDTVSKSNTIDAPIFSSSKDSTIMKLDGVNRMYLYGDGIVKQKDMELQSEYIELDSDSMIIFATFGLDSIGEEFGHPIFIQGDRQSETKEARYNFKTGKMKVSEIITREGEGFLTAERAKKMPDDTFYIEDAEYSTCDEPEHKHFNFRITRGMVQPGKRVVFGPTFLVIEDVPFPVPLPFGFFPFTNEYSSGIIMPTYGDEMTRGFSLRNGGYYFAFNDNVDLALTGEIFTKGSWGLSAKSNYYKRYKFSGNIDADYLVTVQDDGYNPDATTTQKDFKITWMHTQDPKFNPFVTFSSSVDFSTSSFNRNQLDAIYSYDDYSKNTKASRVSLAFRHPDRPFTLSLNASVDQQSRDTTLSMTLPNLTFNVREFYPFKRKVQIGNQAWYEKIRMSYTATMANSISNVKEYDFLQKNIIKDWKNGIRHSIPISASFNMLKYINVSPSVNYNERWYFSRVDKEYDSRANSWVNPDTTYGFYRLYDYNVSVGASTKLYGMYKPWSLFGNWTKGIQIRHVATPTVSFSGNPDFGDPKYGYYTQVRHVAEKGRPDPYYSPFEGQIYGVPSRGQSGTMNFSLENNLEMKLPIAGTDSSRVVSLIDNLSLRMGYNFMLDSMNWSDLSVALRLKFGKAFTLNLQGAFETYTFDEEGTRINVPRWEAGKGIGRLRGTGTSFGYSISNETIKNLFKKKGGDSAISAITENPESNAPPGSAGLEEEESSTRVQSLRKRKEASGDYDVDGYLLLNIPWNLSFNYSLSLSTNMNRAEFNKNTREYPYRIDQTLGLSGSISPTKGWNFNFNASYDFEIKKFATMQCSLARQMHCWSMSASIIPIGPYQSYSFSVAISSSILKDMKYSQSGSSRDALDWGN